MSLAQEEVWKRMVEAELIPQAEADAARDRFEQTGRGDGDVRPLFDWLAQQRLVTPYQVAALAGDARRPLRVGAYKIHERIQQGRLAGIYRASHCRFDFPVCLQLVMPAGSALDIQAQSVRTQREARISAQLDHPHIVKTYQVGRVGQGTFTAFENLQGWTLGELLDANNVMDTGSYTYALNIWDVARGSTVVEVVCRLIGEAALALAHLHEQGVLHRNLGPANLWVGVQGSVKVMDFGLARDSLDFLDLPQADKILTAGCEFLGCTDYLAPEQALDPQKASPASDLYSLGCALYHALAGRIPFEASTPARQMLMHAMQTPPPPSKFNPAVPPALDALTARLMAKLPQNRPASAWEAYDALQTFVDPRDSVVRDETPNEVLQEFLQWLAEQPAAAAPAAGGPPTE